MNNQILEDEEIKGISCLKYHCGDCGADFFSENSKKITNCVLCNSLHINEMNYTFSKEMSYVQFVKTLGEAKKDYKKRIFWNPLIPFVFKRKKTINAITPIYLPAYLANITYTGEVEFLAGDKQKVSKEDGKYIETKRYEDLYEVNVEYQNVLLNTSSKVANVWNQSLLNYNFDNLKRIDSSFDSPCLLQDNSVEDIANYGREKVRKTSLKMVRGDINHQLAKLTKENVTIPFENTKEVLVPVYYVEILYNKKKYYYIMNAEGGSSILKATFGILEAVIFSAFVLLLFLILGFCITYYL